MTRRPSDKKLDRILTDLEEREIERHQTKRRTGSTAPRGGPGTLEHVADAYGEYYGPWDFSHLAPDEYRAAADWVMGRTSTPPPMPTAEIRGALVAYLRNDEIHDLFRELDAVYGDVTYPSPTKRERMIETVREADA